MKSIAKASIWISSIALVFSISDAQNTPEPVYPIPTAKQMEWQEMEFYGFLHFNMNTFTNQEWGYGDQPPEQFNPTALDTRQWARVAKEAGMKGLIITAKHHDGFCLWPSKYTEYSVKNSPWKQGQGDVVRELAEACKAFGLKMGIYLSPWDRNHPEYGTREYVTYFRNQLKELLTGYGDIFEVWFDGANGGDGYYGGASETRRVDKKSYYDWPTTIKLIRQWQPDAIIWSDAGPDARWIGNEHGYSYETTWSPLLRDEVYGGMPEYAKEYASGQINGTHWVPGEADVSIRPGWYYHPGEDNKVKSLKHLLDIYYKSVGRNSTLLLNLPIDRRGLVHENDVRQLQKLTEQLKLDFAEDLAFGKPVVASHTRGNLAQFQATKVNDGDPDTYWSLDDEQTAGSLTMSFQQPTAFNRFLVQEYIALGQRVKAFSLEAHVDGRWISIGDQTTIGYKRILRFDKVVADKIRFTVLDAKACPLISNLEVYNAPRILDAPIISRSKTGLLSMGIPEPGCEIYYTLDGHTPSFSSTRYTKPFELHQPAVITAFSYDPDTQRKSENHTVSFDVSKKQWSVIGSTDVTAIDDNENTWFEIEGQEIAIHQGSEEDITGFYYVPDQRRYPKGIVTHYRFYLSQDGRDWQLVKAGEFSNIVNNPIRSEIRFQEDHEASYFKLVADKVHGKGMPVVTEIGIITK